MRPGDHPEFFRFPAPAGRSRESTIVLDAAGRFHHDRALVEHPGLARAFASWIDVHPEDGRFILNNGYDWSYLQVDDLPYFVLGVSEAGGAVWLHLSDGSDSPLIVESLEPGPGGALSASVKDGRFRARFTPSAQTGLAPWLRESENGDLFFEIAGTRHTLGTFHEGS